MDSARQIAAYLLRLAAQEREPTLITQMHLHKLMYYVQGWALAMRGEPIFPDRIEAWTHGPVVRSLYSVYADHGNQPIPAPDEGAVNLAGEDRAFVESVWEGYKRFSAVKLREMTHREPPWQRAWGDREPDERCEEEISQRDMRDFFRSEYAKHTIPGLEPEKLAQAEAEFANGGGIPMEEVFAE